MVRRYPRSQNRGGESSGNKSAGHCRLVCQAAAADSRTGAPNPSFPEEAPAATTTISLIESVVRARNPAFLSENHRANSPNDRQLHLKFDKTMSNSSLKARVDFFL